MFRSLGKNLHMRKSTNLKKYKIIISLQNGCWKLAVRGNERQVFPSAISHDNPLL